MYQKELLIVLEIIIGISFLRALYTYFRAVWAKSVTETASFLWHRDHRDEPFYRNYFFGPWRHQIKLIYLECRDTFLSRPNLTGISWLQYRLCDLQLTEIPISVRFFLLVPMYMLWFLLYAAHFIELFFSAVFTALLLVIFSILHFIFAAPCSLVAKLVMIYVRTQETQLRVIKKRTVRCTHCLEESINCYYRCPGCQKVHTELGASKFGIWHTKCSCGRILPLTHKDRKFEYEIHEVCPLCGNDLLFATAKNFSLQLIGGSSAGKTTFLSAFWHLYIEKLNLLSKQNFRYHLFPPERFDQMEFAYRDGTSDATVERTAITYTVSHEFLDNDTSLNFAIYDIAGEVFVNSVFDRIQNQFTYCEGLIFLVDPLTSSDFRNHNNFTDEELIGYSQSSPHLVLSSFLENYKNLKNIRKKVIETPITIIITKADLPIVYTQISNEKIRQRYEEAPFSYDFSFDKARDNICKEFLYNIDYSDFLQLIDANFKNAHYYLVSSIGHILNGEPYKPEGVFESIEWLFSKDLKNLFNIPIAEDTNAEDPSAEIAPLEDKPMDEEVKTGFIHLNPEQEIESEENEDTDKEQSGFLVGLLDAMTEDITLKKKKNDLNAFLDELNSKPLPEPESNPAPKPELDFVTYDPSASYNYTPNSNEKQTISIPDPKPEPELDFVTYDPSASYNYIPKAKVAKEDIDNQSRYMEPDYDNDDEIKITLEPVAKPSYASRKADIYIPDLQETEMYIRVPEKEKEEKEPVKNIPKIAPTITIPSSPTIRQKSKTDLMREVMLGEDED